MASVSINRGLPRPEAPASSLPKDQWDDLVIVRKLWAQSQLPFDCRMLKLVAADAPEMAKELGYATEEEFLKKGLQLDPELVVRVVDWLDREKPEKAVTLDHVEQQLARKSEQLQPSGPAPIQGMVSPNPTGRRGKELDAHAQPVPQPWSQAGILRRIKRDHPDIAEQVERGEFKSARAAGIAAGFIKPSPPSLQLKEPAPTAQKLLNKMGQDWCLRLLEELSELCL